MKINSNDCLYGRHVLLMPYLEHHVPTRFKWLQSAGNRLDRSLTPPTLEQEKQTQLTYMCNNSHCIFLVADTETHSDPDSSESESLIGEVHLLIDDLGKGHAFVEIMLTERSVRRRTLICESLLLLLLYGMDILQLSKFSVMIDQYAESTDNRLIFVARDENETLAVPPAKSPLPKRKLASPLPKRKQASPLPKRKLASPLPNRKLGSPLPNKKGSPLPIRNASSAPNSPKSSTRRGIVQTVKDVFSKSQTKYLNTLTRHLLQEDEGQHWPMELDFECIEPTRIMLTMSQESKTALLQMVSQAKRIKYSSIIADGSLRSSSTTRVDGRTLVLIPYGSEHVKLVYRWMQQPEMYTGFDVPPPTMHQETEAQKMMENDPDCHPFIVCSKATSEENCPLFPEGRAQVLITSKSEAQLHIVLVHPDITVKTSTMRETLLMLMYYARLTLPVTKLWMIGKHAVRPKPDIKRMLWSSRLDFEPSTEDPSHVELNIEENAVKIVLRGLTKGMVLRKYVQEDVVYEQGSIT